MDAQEKAVYFYSEIFEVYNRENVSPFEKLMGFRSVYKDIFRDLTEGEAQYFSSVFARTVFILDKFNVPDELASRTKKFRYYTLRLAKNPALKCADYDVKSAFHLLCRLIEHFYNFEPLPEVQLILNTTKYFEFNYRTPDFQTDVIPFVRAVVRKKGLKNSEVKGDKAFAEIICDTEEFGELGLIVSGIWLDIWKLSWKGAVLNLFDVKKVSGDELVLKTISKSLIVLEPDYLLDVTDLAECFQNHQANIKLYFLKKFSHKGVSMPMILGNIINSCFDELIYNKNIDFATAYDNALKAKPLQIFALALKDPEASKMLKPKAEMHFHTLQKVLPSLDSDMISVEPSFLSPKFGLQGRLDVMLEYEEEQNRKNIVELKSGGAPAGNQTLFDNDGDTYQVGLWSNHLAQTTCYNLLLDSAFENRTGSSQILYTSANDYPLRNAPNIIQKKQEILYQRNWIIALERSLSRNQYSLLTSINPKDFGTRPKFMENEVTEFAIAYRTASDLERAYFHLYITFIIREHTAAKIGTGDGRSANGFSSLWKDTIAEKEKSLSILTNLKLNREDSDFQNLYLIFERDADTPAISSIRKGDIAILYRCNEEDNYAPLSQQVLKCSVREITPETVKVSLRNKLFKEGFFENGGRWILEPDFIESTNKCLYQSIYQLLESPQEKKDLLLGLRKPELREIKDVDTNGLNELQSGLLKKALSAKDYFLLQGPPGTGKTSYMLKTIVRNLFEKTDENILVLAYTNRAVDEICSALKKISEDFPFLRLGSKESSQHTDNLISHLAESIGLRELFPRIRKTRVFVSTVSSVLSNPEIMEMKTFGTAVIDEASQILEPHIVGILSNVERFIMIGDEKQLPAIVIQPESNTIVDDENLKSINLNNLGCSLFERLLRCCINNGWTDAYGMLSQQARMHMDIQNFANILFYNNALETFAQNGWQTSNISVFSSGSLNPLEEILSLSRVLFIDSKTEGGRKFHTEEAELTSEIIKLVRKKYGEGFTEQSVGVITPFRAQCAEIFRHLPEELRQLITIDTVERFQGSERDIIIISFAVNHPFHLESLQSITEINGITVDRKLNVAMTRARKHLVMLGNSAILSRSPVFRQLIDMVKAKGGYVGEMENIKMKV